MFNYEIQHCLSQGVGVNIGLVQPSAAYGLGFSSTPKQGEAWTKEIKEIQATGLVAPPGCWIVRYLAKGKRGAYWYYKLQATEAIFPTQTKGKYTKYKHLGKAGNKAYLVAVEQVATRAKIEGLRRAIDTLLQGSADLMEEAQKYKQD